MNDQDIIQSPSEVTGGEELATPAQDTGSSDTAASPATAQQDDGQGNVARTIEPERFNRLQSQYKEALSRLREFDSKSQYYASLEKELQALKQQQQPKGKQQDDDEAIDYSSMPIDQYTKLIIEKAKKESMREFEQNLARQREQQQAYEVQQKKEQRQGKFYERLDTIRSQDPDFDQAAEDQLWKWMDENEVWNPIVAYNAIYRDVLSQKQQAQIEKDVAAKIAQNTGSKLEGSGKNGVIPTPSPDLSSSQAKASAFVGMLKGAP